MITQVYHAEGYVMSWIDHDRELMVVQTFRLDLGDHAKKMFDLNIKALEKFKPKNIILDKSAAIGLQIPAEEETWLRTTLFPEYRKRGLKKVIKIVPKNPIARFGTKNWLDIGKEFGFDFVEIESMEKAYDYLELSNI
jgi:hypothetical protein